VRRNNFWTQDAARVAFGSALLLAKTYRSCVTAMVYLPALKPVQVLTTQSLLCYAELMNFRNKFCRAPMSRPQLWDREAACASAHAKASPKHLRAPASAEPRTETSGNRCIFGAHSHTSCQGRPASDHYLFTADDCNPVVQLLR
jgi:hypothetical protein